MHIGFQKSGDTGGRGEYEVVGSHSGYNAIGLEGWRFNLRWPDAIVRETGLELEPGDSLKPRLRSQQDPPYQIGKMVAAMLLLPDGRRELAKTSSTTPIATFRGYVLTRLGFGPDTEFDPVTDLVTIDPAFVNLTNLAGRESIGVEKRWARVVAVYAAASQYAPAVRTELDRHRTTMASGELLTGDLTRIVSSLLRQMDAAYPSFSRVQDPLPELERIAGLTPAAGPTLPPPDELGEDEPEVSARSAHEYRLARVRGPQQGIFSRAVREAYGHRCMFCGGIFGGVPGIRSGLEAAHILAWSKYDLDVLHNGMSLCKTHHWAFDAGLVVPELSGGNYFLRFTMLSLEFEPRSMRLLGHDGFQISDEWLPADTSQRPQQKYLRTLYEDLAITFIS